MATADSEKRRPRAVRKRATRQSVRAVKASRERERKRRRTSVESTPKEQKASAIEARKIKENESKPDRKAPTPIAETKRQIKQRNRMYLVTGALILVGIISSAAVGLTDGGQIDVDATIKARRNSPESEKVVRNNKISLPVQHKNNQPDGGLKGGVMTNSGPQKSKIVPAKTENDKSASSSEPIASSTAQVASSSEDIKEADDNSTAAEKSTSTTAN